MVKGYAQAKFTTLNHYVWKLFFYAFHMNIYVVQYISKAHFAIFIRNGQIMEDLLNLQKYKKNTLLHNFSPFIGNQTFCNVFKFVSVSEDSYSNPTSIENVTL